MDAQWNERLKLSPSERFLQFEREDDILSHKLCNPDDADVHIFPSSSHPYRQQHSNELTGC